MHLPPPARFRVGDETHLGEIDLALHTRVTVQHPDRRAAGPEPALRRREPVQRAVRHPGARPGQQVLDLHQRLAVLDPPGDVRPAGRQRLPRSAVTVRAGRPNPLDHRADQLVAQRRLAGVPDQPGGLRRLDIATGGLPVDPGAFGDRA